ncbi:TetR family transcriptional regulator [Rhodococcus sp. RS1C4]|nr:TetR/AcrR family transcriptional regulator [Rhodococcus sp. RS1C4]OZC56276.1 TetR family transcriptional regulator [Rhodococcus sp. RS1C4]
MAEVLDTRAKIIIAACEMIGEDQASTLSVRSVAARAGVSMGSLRHHFPTQRALRDAVLETIYDVVTTDDQVIHDETVPARDRLVQCLRLILSPLVGDKAREAWLNFMASFVEPEPTDRLRASYAAITDEGRRRVEHWLGVLDKEGARADGDLAQQATFLNTVVTGLSLDRAMPIDHSVLHTETATLYFAVDAVLTPASGG